METTVVSKNIAREIIEEINGLFVSKEEGNIHAMTFILSVLLEQEKKIQSLEAHCESLAYRLRQEQELRREKDIFSN